MFQGLPLTQKELLLCSHLQLWRGPRADLAGLTGGPWAPPSPSLVLASLLDSAACSDMPRAM